MGKSFCEIESGFFFFFLFLIHIFINLYHDLWLHNTKAHHQTKKTLYARLRHHSFIGLHVRTFPLETHTNKIPVCCRTKPKIQNLGFVETMEIIRFRIFFFLPFEQWKWFKTLLYIFYQQINNHVCVCASPSVVIASGQPAVSDTDGVLKPGGGTAGEKVLSLTFKQSLILAMLWSFQLRLWQMWKR